MSFYTQNREFYLQNDEKKCKAHRKFEAKPVTEF